MDLTEARKAIGRKIRFSDVDAEIVDVEQGPYSIVYDLRFDRNGTKMAALFDTRNMDMHPQSYYFLPEEKHNA
jgi:hypothetical protein